MFSTLGYLVCCNIKDKKTTNRPHYIGLCERGKAAVHLLATHERCGTSQLRNLPANPNIPPPTNELALRLNNCQIECQENQSTFWIP